jgi:hypothetical protein
MEGERRWCGTFALFGFFACGLPTQGGLWVAYSGWIDCVVSIRVGGVLFCCVVVSTLEQMNKRK